MKYRYSLACATTNTIYIVLKIFTVRRLSTHTRKYEQTRYKSKQLGFCSGNNRRLEQVSRQPLMWTRDLDPGPSLWTLHELLVTGPSLAGLLPPPSPQRVIPTRGNLWLGLPRASVGKLFNSRARTPQPSTLPPPTPMLCFCSLEGPWLGTCLQTGDSSAPAWSPESSASSGYTFAFCWDPDMALSTPLHSGTFLNLPTEHRTQFRTRPYS